ncbi:Sec7-like domain is implicated in guanine nucleotide exchange function [Mycena leptocephala]|nr:Sec7-like domain is implicated in guanine nucleotide exchange function [Mycena leptocephala]
MASSRRTVSQKHVLYSEILSVTSAMRKNSRWASATHFVNTKDSSALGSNLGLRVSNSSQGARRISREADLMLGFEELKRAVRDIEDIMTVPLPTLLAPFFAIVRSPLSTGPITSTALSALHSFFVCGLISSQSLSLETALVELSSTVSHCKFEASDSSGDEVVLLRIMTVIHDCLCGGVESGLGDVEVCEMLETVLTTCCQMRLTETLRRSAENTMHSLVRTEKLLAADEDAPDAEIRMTVSATEATLNEENSQELIVERGEDSVDPEDAGRTPSSAATVSRPEYGLPSILELLRVLINVLDPNDQQHTDSTRLVALGILNAAFEASGPRIPDFPSLEVLILDTGCKFLFQLARSENISGNGLYTGSPRPGTPVPASPALGPPEKDSETGILTPSRVLVTPARGETRDLILETLSQISRHPSFMNVFERLIDFLTKAVYPSHYPGGLDARQRNVQYLCLDLLLAFVNDMAARADGSAQSWPSEFPEPESLIHAKSQKKLIVTAAARFNTKPKQGVAFLEENQLIYTDLPADAPESAKAHNLAVFLKGCARLDKRLLGDYLSREENLPLLKAFMGLFDFRNKPIADAMRELVETFRLPGEAQQIARITETFASVYFASGPDEIQNEDAVYVLAYSIILLNTDLHNPQVRKRMTIEDYTRNLRGVNNNTDFSAEFLQNIYDSIRKSEIIMPEEHVGQLGFEYAWKDLLTRARDAGNLMICNSALFDVDMFKSVWKPVISAIAYAFISFDDDYIIQRSIAGFRQCATLAGHFQLPDVFDFVVVSLSQATSLLSEFVPGQVPNFPVVDFGTNFKGQLAAVVLFNIVNGNGNALREGWTQMEDFLGGVSMIPLRGGHPPRNTLCAIDCITSCRLDELYSQIMWAARCDALIAAVRALEALAHDRTVARLKLGADDDSNHPSSDDGPFPCLTIRRLPIVFEHLSALLSTSTQYSFLLIERAVVALLRLCLIIAKKPSLRDQIYVSFDVLSCLPASIIAGVLLLVQNHKDIISSQTEWNLVFGLLRSTILHPEAARPSFELITSLVSDGPEQTVTIDNFSGLLALLDDFATTAGVVAEDQHRQGRRQEPLTSANSPPIERGRKAIDLMVNLKKFMSPLSESAHLPQTQAWRQMCLPLISSLSRQSTNAAREVRHTAISQLQRMLLGPHVLFDEADTEQVDEIFNRVIFPLLDDLLKPQVFHRDPRGMPETRLRASALLCKAFMHFEVRESQANADIRILWIQILDLLDRLMNIDKGDQLYEAVPESLKNVVLVMHAAQILVPPPAEGDDTRDARQRTLWTATNERVERFLPGFIASVIPQES